MVGSYITDSRWRYPFDRNNSLKRNRSEDWSLAPRRMLDSTIADLNASFSYYFTGSNREVDVNSECISLSFACGGWLQFYMFGVAKCFLDNGLQEKCKCIGSSAGALTSVGLVTGGDFDSAVALCKRELIPQVYKNALGPFRVAEYVGRCLDFTRIPDLYDELDGRVTVVTTRIPSFASQRDSEFESSVSLRTALVASAAAFPLAPVVCWNKKLYIDGGISDFQPIFDKNTVTVNPFYFSRADIRPSRYVPAWWAFLPPKDPTTVDWLYHLGYLDCMSFLEKHGFPIDHKAREKMMAKVKEAGPHKYDIRRRYNSTFGSFHRVVGYDITLFGISRCFDILLLLWLTVIWKPLAVSCIYVELISSMLAVFAIALSKELMSLLSLVMVCIALLAPHMSSILVGVGALVAAKLAAVGPTMAARREWSKFKSCGAALLSTNLALKSIPVVGRTIEIGQHAHERLVKDSLVYRLALHII